MKKLTALLAAALVLVVTGVAMADTATNTLTVTATINGTCSIDSNTLDFGVVDPFSGSDHDGSVGVTVHCTNGTTGTYTASYGDNVFGGIRRMKHATLGNYLKYRLYSDSGRTTEITPTVGPSMLGTGSAEILTLYGRIANSDIQNPAAGVFSDTVVLTVTYTP